MSRHSGLSGIGCLCDVLVKKDSGQAGMTVLRYFMIFYESVILINQALLHVIRPRRISGHSSPSKVLYWAALCYY